MDKPFPAYKGDQAYVFVCYAHDDAEVVYPEMQWLREQGINIWYDEGIAAGGIWRAEIAAAIESASKLVYFVSRASVASEHCNREVDYALDRIPVVPLYVENADLPADLRIGLTRVQALHRDAGYSHRKRLLEALTDPSSSPARKQRPADAKRARWITVGAGLAAIFAMLVYWFAFVRPTQDVPITAIAVLPLEDQSPADHQYLADGLTSSLRDALNRIPSLTIAGRTSTRKANTTSANLEMLGELLGVGSIVDGSVQVVGGGLKVVAEWTRVRDGSQLWSARYEREIQDINDVPGIQNEIAKAIAEAIRLELGIGETLHRLPPQSNLLEGRYEPTDVRAWQLMLECSSLIYRFSTEGFAEAESLCLRAIEIDPNYAQAYGQLALVYLLRGDLDDPNGNTALAERTVRKAIELDPNSVAGNWVLAHLSMRQWDLSAADERLERAIQARPSLPFLALAKVVLRWRQGKLDEALAEARRAVSLEPMWVSAQSYLGMAHLALGDHEAAVAALQNASTLGAMTRDARVALAVAYEMDGQSDKAMETMVAALPNFESEIRLGFETNGWKGIGHALAEAAPIDACPAWMHALAGEEDEMYECLEIALVSRATELPEILHASPAFAPYRREGRFQDLVERVSAQIR